jgi:PAS domain S-box-containing protein
MFVIVLPRTLFQRSRDVLLLLILSATFTLGSASAQTNHSNVTFAQSFQSRQLSEKFLPTAWALVFEEPTFWQRYKWRILGVSGLLLLQTLLIAGLLVERARRWRVTRGLSESEERYRNVVQTQTELICRYLPDTTLTFVNDAYCRYFGKTRAELIGTKYIDLIPDHARHATLSYVNSLIENPQTVVNEHEAILSDGTICWQQWIDHVIVNGGGRVKELQGIGRDITDRKRLEEERLHAEQELGQLTARLFTLQDEERRRIARELHDGTAQNLFAISIDIDRIRQQSAKPNSEVSALLDETESLCEQSLQEIRTLSYLLHPPLLDQAGLVSALKWYIDGFIKRTGIEVDLVAFDSVGRMRSEIETALFRIVQESLTNIRRHSRSETASIKLRRENDQILLEIEDRGQGMNGSDYFGPTDEFHDLGVGIPGMRQRMRQLGGRLDIKTGGAGTIVTAAVPLPDGTARAS